MFFLAGSVVLSPCIRLDFPYFAGPPQRIILIIVSILIFECFQGSQSISKNLPLQTTDLINCLFQREVFIIRFLRLCYLFFYYCLTLFRSRSHYREQRGNRRKNTQHRLNSHAAQIQDKLHWEHNRNPHRSGNRLCGILPSSIL